MQAHTVAAPSTPETSLLLVLTHLVALPCRDLFYGLWASDLFMQRVEANAEWSLFCPNEAPGLADCWGAEHEALYTKYEREGRAKKVIKAQQLWFAILEGQVWRGALASAF